MCEKNKIIFLWLNILLLASQFSFATEYNNDEMFSRDGINSKVSLYNLGWKYSIGDGVKEDKSIALQYYERSANLGYAPAQNNVGWFYRQGIATKQEPMKAIYWFRLSALQGNALALQNLAEMYQAAEGVPKDMYIAKSFYALCATEIITDFPEREAGFNNAIHECRREMGKIESVSAEDDQEGLRLAALWFTVSLVKNKDLQKDTEKGVKARKSIKETKELLNIVSEKLDKKSKAWVKDSAKKWDSTRIYIRNLTPFPLVHEGCFNSLKSL
jgi:TPR repeat protein